VGLRQGIGDVMFSTQITMMAILAAHSVSAAIVGRKR
jgi:hypothetical protein